MKSNNDWYGRMPPANVAPFTDLFIKSLTQPRQAGRGYTTTWLSFNERVESELKRKWTRRLPWLCALILPISGIAVWLRYGWL